MLQLLVNSIIVHRFLCCNAHVSRVASHAHLSSCNNQSRVPAIPRPLLSASCQPSPQPAAQRISWLQQLTPAHPRPSSLAAHTLLDTTASRQHTVSLTFPTVVLTVATRESPTNAVATDPQVHVHSPMPMPLFNVATVAAYGMLDRGCNMVLGDLHALPPSLLQHVACSQTSSMVATYSSAKHLVCCSCCNTMLSTT